jgi:hypothetical protein
MAPVTESELAAREEPAPEVIVVSKPKPKAPGDATKANPRDLLRRALAGMAEPEAPQS